LICLGILDGIQARLLGTSERERERMEETRHSDGMTIGPEITLVSSPWTRVIDPCIGPSRLGSRLHERFEFVAFLLGKARR
jgi:hypothetical protein